MRVSLNSLPGNLNKGFQPLYLVFGAETLLAEEALDQLRSCARKSGYLERIRLTAERGFDWDQLLQQSQATSLFSEKRLIELRLPTGKPGVDGAKALVSFTENPNTEDTALLVISGDIEKRSQNTKWFKAMERTGTVIECPAVKKDNLPDWISRRLSTQGIKYEAEAVAQLSHFVEGNLLAAAQEINLLGLLYPGETISVDHVEQVIADHARFDVSSFADACLGGSVQRVIRILQSLKREQAEPILILWVLAREVRILCQLSAARDDGEKEQSLFQRYGVWGNKSGAVTTALNRLSRKRLENSLRRIGRADRMVKGMAPLERKDIWEEIESISLGICGSRIQ